MEGIMPAVLGLAVLNTGLLTAIFYRLGSLGERVSDLERRTERLERRTHA